MRDIKGLPKKNTQSPPVHLWNPALSGDIDIVIKNDGTWFHEGSIIARHDLAKLFGSILKREGDEYFLVTPVEKWRMQVEDVPFIAQLLELDQGSGLPVITLLTNMQDRVTLAAESAFELRQTKTGEAVPYVEIRRGLFARVSRSVFYEMVELAVQDGGELFLESSGCRFCLGSVE